VNIAANLRKAILEGKLEEDFHFPDFGKYEERE
jgi:hypothetical protein